VKFALIAEKKAKEPLSLWCRGLGVSRAGFYAWRRRPECQHQRDDQRLSVLVQESHERSRKTYGSPRVHADLVPKGEHVSRKRVIRHHERARPACGAQYPESPIRSRAAQPALGRRHHRIADRQQRQQSVPGRDRRPIRSIRRRVGTEVFHNQQRRHSSIGNVPPAEAERRYRERLALSQAA